jgi:hypothetical protein
MKTLALLLTLFLFSDKYSEQMTNNILVVYTSSSNEEILKSVNVFERIAAAEKTKWEPYYYASFGYVMMATKEADGAKKDLLLDMAKSAIDKATAIKPNESEIAALEGFIHMFRVTIDPASRGQEYSTKAMQSYGKALGLNPENPRALALMAQLQFGTAKFFNQQPTEACQSAQKALALFEAKPFELSIAPTWGREMAAELVKACK